MLQKNRNRGKRNYQMPRSFLPLAVAGRLPCPYPCLDLNFVSVTCKTEGQSLVTEYTQAQQKSKLCEETSSGL